MRAAIAADLAQNTLLRNLWQSASKPTNQWSAWLGDAVAIKDPTCAVFRKQSGSNLLMLGQQEDGSHARVVTGNGRYTLDLHVGAGQIDVERAP